MLFRSVNTLEQAVAVLEGQFERVEAVKAEVGALDTEEKIPESEQQTLLS